MRSQLYCGHANATALSSSPVVSAQGSVSDDPGSSPGRGKALCPWDVRGKKMRALLLGLAKSIYYYFIHAEIFTTEAVVSKPSSQLFTANQIREMTISRVEKTKGPATLGKINTTQQLLCPDSLYSSRGKSQRMTNEDLYGEDSKLLLLTQPKILRWKRLGKNGQKKLQVTLKQRSWRGKLRAGYIVSGAVKCM